MRDYSTMCTKMEKKKKRCTEEGRKDSFTLPATSSSNEPTQATKGDKNHEESWKPDTSKGTK